MTNKNTSTGLGPGRPPHRDLDLNRLLQVDVGRALMGMSVHGYCMAKPRKKAKLFRDQAEPLDGSTLRRRYTLVKSQMAPAVLPGDVQIPSPLAQAYAEFLERILADLQSRA